MKLRLHCELSGPPGYRRMIWWVDDGWNCPLRASSARNAIRFYQQQNGFPVAPAIRTVVEPTYA